MNRNCVIPACMLSNQAPQSKPETRYIQFIVNTTSHRLI